MTKEGTQVNAKKRARDLGHQHPKAFPTLSLRDKGGASSF
jgi:hypothetical protein